MKQYIVTCSNCKKQYDVADVAKKAKGKDLYCPHCKIHVGIKNN